MPFTFAHPAAVVGLVRRPRLNAVALVAGSMAPDFEYFVRFRLRSDISHTWLGLLLFTVPMALLLTGLYAVIESPFRRLWPRRWRERIARCDEVEPAKWRAGVLLVSATLGGLSHIVWDGLTHAHGMFVRRIAWLREIHVSLPSRIPHLGDQLVLYRALQHVSTLLGALVLVAFIATLPAIRTSAPDGRRDRQLRWLALSTAIPLGVAAACLPAIDLGTRVVRGIDGLLIGVIGSCLLYRAAVSADRGQARDPT